MRDESLVLLSRRYLGAISAHEVLDAVDDALQPRAQSLPHGARRVAPRLVAHLASEDRVDLRVVP